MRILVEHESYLYEEIHIWDFDQSFARKYLYHGCFLDYVKYEGQNIPDLLLLDDSLYHVFPVICQDSNGRQWDKSSVRLFIRDSLFSQGYADVLRTCGMWYIDATFVDGVFRQSPLGYSGPCLFRIVCIVGTGELRSRLSELPTQWRSLPMFPKSFFISNFFSSLLGKSNFHIFCMYEDVSQFITVKQSTYSESHSINLGWGHIARMCDEQGLILNDVFDGGLSGIASEVFGFIIEFIISQWIEWMKPFCCFGYDVILCGGGVRIRTLIDLLQIRLQESSNSYILPFRYSTQYGSYDFCLDETRLIPFAAFDRYQSFVSSKVMFFS